MPRPKVKLHSQGVFEVLNCQGVRNDIERRTTAIRDAANSMHNAKGYEGDVIATDRPTGPSGQRPGTREGRTRSTTRFSKHWTPEEGEPVIEPGEHVGCIPEPMARA